MLPSHGTPTRSPTLECLDARPYCLDAADDFVTGHDRQPGMRQFAIGHMQIGAANPAGLYRHHDFAGACHRSRPLAQHKRRSWALKHHGMHVLHHSFFHLTAEHHRSQRMRTDTAQPIRLQDYRPPEWLVDRVSLDVSLHPTSARVKATLSLKPNPASAAAPLVLDGDGLQPGFAQARRGCGAGRQLCRNA